MWIFKHTLHIKCVVVIANKHIIFILKFCDITLRVLNKNNYLINYLYENIRKLLY